MKTVTITVTTSEGTETITMEFTPPPSNIMPKELDDFIVEHVGGRPTDR